MSRPLVVVMPVTLVALAGAAFAAERSGEEIYVTTCASCHRSNGRGVPASLTALAIEPRNFADCRRTTPEPDQDWLAVIVGGGPARI